MRTIAVVLLAAAGLGAAMSFSMGLSGQTSQSAGSVQVFDGVTHVAYLGPTLPVEEALNDAAQFITAVWFFDRFDPASPWKLWSAGLPNALQGFTALTFGEAYFTVSSRTFLWNYSGGAVPDPDTGVELAPGGNSVVYFGPTQPVEDALAAAVPGTASGQLTVNVIWRYDPSQNPNQPWSQWSLALPAALRGFDQLTTGQPYFIVAQTPGTLSFVPPPPAAVQEIAIVENYAATTFFPSRFVLIEDRPVRIYFSRLHQEHINQFTISPFVSRTDRILPGQVAFIDFLPDVSGSFEIRNVGHNFGAPLVIAVDEAEAIVERTASGLQEFALIYRLADRTIFPQRTVVQVGIPVKIHNLGVDANFRVSIEPFYPAVIDNVARREVSTFTFTPDRTGTFVIRDELHGLEATLVVQ